MNNGHGLNAKPGDTSAVTFTEKLTDALDEDLTVFDGHGHPPISTTTASPTLTLTPRHAAG